MRRLIGLAVGIGAIVLTVTTVALGASGPTLTAGERVAGLPAVVYGNSVTLSGRESFGGSRSFVLQVQVFPFTSPFHTVARGKTTGSYSIAVKPAHASRYRVKVGSATTSVLTVYVLGRPLDTICNLCQQSNSPGTHTLIVTSDVLNPPGPVAIRGPWYFYYGQVNGRVPPRTLRLVKRAPLIIHGQDFSSSVTYRVRFPAGKPFTFNFTACLKDVESEDGIGLPGHHHCGDASVRLGEYLG
jgi:hypothetical protein